MLCYHTVKGKNLGVISRIQKGTVIMNNKKNKKWTDTMSLTLSRVIVWVLAVIFAAAVIYATASLISSSWGPLALVWDMGLDPVGFYIAFYACAVLAFTALFFLNKLLSNISRGKVFIGENVKLIRILSWCCYLVGIVLAVYSIWVYPFIVIAAAAAFFGLIIRVLKNVFAKAVQIQEENEGTI